MFSDIEGSTLRWEAHREAMRTAVARHDDLLRAVFLARSGHVFKSIGDGFCVAFARPEDALAAASDAQRALNDEDFSAVDGIRVRIALHTGTADERDDDYFGPEVNRVARLMAIGHGGQVLLSQATCDLTRDELPAHTSLADLGSHRLKDLAHPEHVWQLNTDGLLTIFPQLTSLDERPNNLPIQPTSFRGRERDLQEVKELVDLHRVLTIVGSGGIGKTRLALQAGADLLDNFADGVWFADISPISDPALVASIVAGALGIAQVQGRSLDELIPQRLKRKRLLLIIDNCEHLLEPVAALVDAIQHAAPEVRILATSRQAIGVAGEATYRLPSLAVPEAGSTPNADDAMRYGSIAVFVDRARLVDAHFALTNDNVPIVAEICRRLDGIPLAIELAAARVKVLSIPNLAHRLDERFKILTGGSRTALPRQKTLIALIDWSYDLLTSQEQRLFARLGIFASSFSLDAAMRVWGDGPDEVALLDLLSSLTDKSLVVADTAGEQERYRLLESTRAYALEKLDTAGERELMARRHAECFRDRAHAADERYGTASRLAWLTEVEMDLDNYRAALSWSSTQGDGRVVSGVIAGALCELWTHVGLAVEGRYWIGLALKQLSETEHPTVAARLWRAIAKLSAGKSGVAASEHALRLYESAGDALGAARARSQLAWGLYQSGRLDEAEAVNARALETFRQFGDRWGVADAIYAQAGIARSRGDTIKASALYADEIAGFRAIGDEIGVANALVNIAELEFQEGHASEAARLTEEALEFYRRRKDTNNLATASINLGAYRLAIGDSGGAREAAREGLRLGREVQDGFQAAVAIQHLALVAALKGQPDSSARLVGFVDAQYKAFDQQRLSTELWAYEKLQAALRETLPQDEIERLAAEGQAWSEDRAVEQALSI